MITKATMKPGQNGTKRFVEKYGDQLVCVRYKYDSEMGKRYTTVELVEHESDWAAEPPDSAQGQASSPTQRLAVRVEYWETEIREKVKAAGGIWRPRQKLWEVRYEDVVALGLESRVVGDESSVSDA